MELDDASGETPPAVASEGTRGEGAQRGTGSMFYDGNSMGRVVFKRRGGSEGAAGASGPAAISVCPYVMSSIDPCPCFGRHRGFFLFPIAPSTWKLQSDARMLSLWEECGPVCCARIPPVGSGLCCVAQCFGGRSCVSYGGVFHFPACCGIRCCRGVGVAKLFHLEAGLVVRGAFLCARRSVEVQSQQVGLARGGRACWC